MQRNVEPQNAIPNLSPQPGIESLKILDGLSSEYMNSLKRVVSFLEPLIRNRPRGNEEFTDHDMQHSVRLLQRVGQILPDSVRLNESEIYILALSALLHDIGMWISKEEATEKIEASEEFIDFARREYPLQFNQHQTLNGHSDKQWIADSALLIISAAFAREHHPERLGEVVLNSESTTGVSIRSLIGEEFVELVFLVSVSHSWEKDRVIEDDLLRPRIVGVDGDTVELRFLSFLLRLGDLLDFGSGRVSKLLWHFLEPLNSVSESHWRKEAAIRIERCEPDLIQISGVFNTTKGGVETAEAYRLALDWIGYIKSEIQSVGYQLSHCLPEHYAIGKLKVDATRVNVEGLAIKGHVEFSLSRKDIIRLLGNELYSGDYIFVRELIQNAVDSTRLRLCREKEKRAAVAKENNSSVEIKVEECDASEDLTVFTIRDYGVGMDLHILEKYFLRVGKSFYRSADFLKTDGFSPISRFGIGFLSCLLVADRIEITSRTEDSKTGLRLTLQKPSEYFLVENILDVTDSSFEAGTEVVLWINEKKLQDSEGDRIPIKDPDLMSELGVYGDHGNLKCAILQYSLFLEVPIFLNQVKIKRFNFRERKICTSIESVSSSGFSQVECFDLEGNEVAEGGLTIPLISENGLPAMFSKMGAFGSGSSIVLSSRGMYGLSDVNPDQPCVGLNLIRAPDNLLTAGREIRKDSLHFVDLKTNIIRNFLKMAFQKIKRELGIEIASLWRLSIRGSEKATGLPVLLPVRSRKGLEWMSAKDAINQFDRMLLVPFDFAIQVKTWARHIPCLGLPGARLRSDLDLSFDSFKGGIDDCRLVPLNVLTGILWPPDADGLNIKFLRKPATNLEMGIHFWGFDSKDSSLCRIRNSTFVSQEFLNAEDMPHYDWSGNPWIEFGLNRAPFSTESLLGGDIHNQIADKLSKQTISLPRKVKVSFNFCEKWA